MKYTIKITKTNARGNTFVWYPRKGVSNRTPFGGMRTTDFSYAKTWSRLGDVERFTSNRLFLVMTPPDATYEIVEIES